MRREALIREEAPCTENGTCPAAPTPMSSTERLRILADSFEMFSEFEVRIDTDIESVCSKCVLFRQTIPLLSLLSLP